MHMNFQIIENQWNVKLACLLEVIMVINGVIDKMCRCSQPCWPKARAWQFYSLAFSTPCRATTHTAQPCCFSQQPVSRSTTQPKPVRHCTRPGPTCRMQTMHTFSSTQPKSSRPRNSVWRIKPSVNGVFQKYLPSVQWIPYLKKLNIYDGGMQLNRGTINHKVRKWRTIVKGGMEFMNVIILKSGGTMAR